MAGRKRLAFGQPEGPPPVRLPLGPHEENVADGPVFEVGREAAVGERLGEADRLSLPGVDV